jgi:hypothetical protein
MANTGDGNFPNQGGWLKGRGRGISALVKTNNGYLIWNDWFFESSGSSVNVNPLTGQLDLISFSPTVTATDNKNITVGLAQLLLTGIEPTVTTTNNINVSPQLAQLTLTGYSPTISTGGGSGKPMYYYDGVSWQLVTNINVWI